MSTVELSRHRTAPTVPGRMAAWPAGWPDRAG